MCRGDVHPVIVDLGGQPRITSAMFSSRIPSRRVTCNFVEKFSKFLKQLRDFVKVDSKKDELPDSIRVREDGEDAVRRGSRRRLTKQIVNENSIDVG